MPTLSVYNKEGKELGKIRLPKEIFDIEINNDLLYQAIRIQLANRRKYLAKTKDRGEVRGGGKKPWRQKGTGRARHGSIRSPLWVGGGVVFGPRTEKIFERKINKKAKRKAICMALSSKLKDREIFIVDKFDSDGKTKTLFNLIQKIIALKSKKKSVLFILSKKDDATLRAVSNISGAGSLAADSLNVLDLLSFKYLLMDKEAIKVIDANYSSRKKRINEDSADKNNDK